MTTTHLPYLAAVSVRGEDAGSFLQAQLSADLDPLQTGQSCLAAYCEPRGNVLAVLRVEKRENDYLLLLEKSLRDGVLKRLGMYVLRARVEFEALDDAVVGKLVNEVLEYDLVEAGSDPGAGLVENWRAAELRRGLAWLGSQTAGQFLPQMLGLERLGAVSFKKGCFPGQEIIARLRYLGKLKRFPLLLRAASGLELAPGQEVTLLADSAEDKAAVVDCALDGDSRLVFVVTRLDPENPPLSMQVAGQNLAVEVVAQAWATI